jgi:hypothetical protein
MENVVQVLVSMGYRQMNRVLWGKPVGMALLTYNTRSSLWECRVKGVKEKILFWSGSNYEPAGGEDFLRFIMECEAYGANYATTPNEYPDFSFISPSEKLLLLSQ